MVNEIVYVYGRNISIKMILLICGDICGIRSNIHILILFFVVNPPFFCDELTCESKQFRKKTDVYLVRGFIEAEHKSIQSPPYNRPILWYYSPAVISKNLPKQAVFPHVSIIIAVQILNTKH